MTAQENQASTESVRFRKQQLLLKTGVPGWQKDLYRALLEDDKLYTSEQANQMIEEFLIRKV